MVDKNLFPYDLAVVAIFKDEGRYLKEWLDYHLLAGVEHFYLYNNESSDNYAEVLKPYVEANLVTLIDWPGKIMQYPAYDDAVERFRFFCRYMAFIDLDEFIFPKTNQSIVEVVDEVLSNRPDAAGLLVNWQVFGSNGQETADYSKGVLERFTSRAPDDWNDFLGGNFIYGNSYWKVIVNPRSVKFFKNPHSAVYFGDVGCVNSNGVADYDCDYGNVVAADKIVLNHYFTKSKEEFVSRRLGNITACWANNPYEMQHFIFCDRNEVFDDGILTYRAARAENFSLTDDTQRLRRVEKVLVDTLTAQSPFDEKPEFFTGKLETFLMCRKLAEVFGTRIGNRSAEEYALVWIYQTLTQAPTVKHTEVRLFMKALPDILTRPFPLTKKLLQLTCDVIIPTLSTALKAQEQWSIRFEFLELQKFLKLLG